MNLRALALLFVGLTALVGCVEQDTRIPSPEDLEVSEQDLLQIDVRHSAGFFTVAPDFRRCISPLCGGYWVKALNQRVTRCVNGEYADRCYVAELDWEALGLAREQVDELRSDLGRLVLQGRTTNRSFGDFGNLGAFLPGRAWLSATEGPAGGSFFRTESLGVVCFAQPCFNMRASLLNSLRSWPHSGLDLRRVGADREALSMAREAHDAGDLLVSGRFQRDRPRARTQRPGLTLQATQFYLPVESLQCVVDEGCTSSPYHSPVNNEDECYCPLCGLPMSMAEAQTNGRGWREHCSHMERECPLPPCPAPPPVGCEDNQCTYVFDF